MLLFRGPAQKVYSVTCFTLLTSCTQRKFSLICTRPKANILGSSTYQKTSPTLNRIYSWVSLDHSSQINKAKRKRKRMEPAQVRRTRMPKAPPPCPHHMPSPSALNHAARNEVKGGKKEQPVPHPVPPTFITRPRPRNEKTAHLGSCLRSVLLELD